MENLSYQEKNIAVSLFTTLLIFIFYGVRMLHIYEDGNVEPSEVYSLWGIVVVLGIISNIAANIITQVVLTVFTGIMTGDMEEEPLIADERDNLIGLKGMRNSFFVMGGGVFIAMGTQVLGMSALTMFNLILFFSILSALVGDASQLYYYRRGF